MTSRMFLLSVLAVSLVGCSDDESSTTPADDTGVAADTATATDSGSGADTGASADTASPSDTGADAPATPSCATYCDTVGTNCTGAKNPQYLDSARCLAMCAKMTVGTLGDSSGDTVGCRLAQASAAKDSPDLSCPRAGATGGGTCGTTRCDAFCKLAMAQCSTGAPFASESECKTQCAAVPFDGSAAGGEIDPSAVGKLNCLQYHLQAAYQSSAAATTHCPHLTIGSGPCKG